MQITRNSRDTIPGPRDWFTGAVYIDQIAAPSPPSRVGAGSVHFTPRPDPLAHPPDRSDDLRHRRRRALPAPFAAMAGANAPTRRKGALRTTVGAEPGSEVVGGASSSRPGHRHRDCR